MRLVTFGILLFIGLKNHAIAQPEAFRIMFYNVENLFDTVNDSTTIDEEFLPEGMRYWTKSRYYDKLNKTAKVICAAGEGNLPILVGLCEIENYEVLEALINYSPLRNAEYGYLHQESADARGVDVALLYRKSVFKPIDYNAYKVHLPGDRTTRDILHAYGTLPNGDTLHVFVNHWSSRLGGQAESEPNRLAAAQRLKELTDSIFALNADANIIIGGDFNDYPESKSISKVLNAALNLGSPTLVGLFNLTYSFWNKTGKGSHKMNGYWGMLDQLIVSGNLLTGTGKTQIISNSCKVFDADFLLEPDDTYNGYKPKRTYVGYRYNGGFSDHLPVVVDLKIVLNDK